MLLAQLLCLTLLAPRPGIAIGLLRPISAIVPCRIASSLSADRRWRPPKFQRNRPLASSTGPHRPHDVSFFLGEMAISHVATPFLPVRGSSKYCLSPFTRKGCCTSSLKPRCLTWRSTGPIAAGRHLGYKSLAQTPARRNRPFSLYVRSPSTRPADLDVQRKAQSPDPNAEDEILTRCTLSQ